MMKFILMLAMMLWQGSSEYVYQAELFLNKNMTCGGIGEENICGGYIETPIYIPVETFAITIMARGQDAPPGQWPVMEVSFDSVAVPIGPILVASAEYRPYTFTVPMLHAHTMRIRLANDFFDPNLGDRNLIVDKVTFVATPQTVPPQSIPSLPPVILPDKIGPIVRLF